MLAKTEILPKRYIGTKGKPIIEIISYVAGSEKPTHDHSVAKKYVSILSPGAATALSTPALG